MTSEAPLVSIRDLQVDYITEAGPARAVRGVSLDIHRGEVVGLAGESGCGKSTLGMSILRVLRPPAVISGGHILVGGDDVLDMDESALRAFRWARVSLVMQAALNALNPVYTVQQHLLDTLDAHRAIGPGKTGRAEAIEHCRGLLQRVHIDPSHLASYPHGLSGGMRQRVVIAMALALEPELVILDEPTTALDVVVQHEILAELQTLQREQGFAMLFISHDLPIMVDIADRIGVMYSGRIVELGPATRIKRHPQHPYTKGLLGAHPGLFEARLARRGIPGYPPALLAPPEGCRFHPRCERVGPRCQSGAEPSLTALSDGVAAACFDLEPGGTS